MTTISSPILRATLEETVKLLNDAAWEGRVNAALVQQWLAQFSDDSESPNDEVLHALFLLSHFLYFGHTEIRCLLKSLYRDMVRAPALHRIRRDHDDILDRALLLQQYHRYLSTTRFLAVGNPSESGMHLLYYFRQENALPKDLFLAPHDISLLAFLLDLCVSRFATALSNVMCFSTTSADPAPRLFSTPGASFRLLSH